MSIINRMLQDLAQQQQSAVPLPAQVAIVPEQQTPSVPKWVWFVIAGIINLCVLFGIAWFYLIHPVEKSVTGIHPSVHAIPGRHAVAALHVMPATPILSASTPPKSDSVSAQPNNKASGPKQNQSLSLSLSEPSTSLSEKRKLSPSTAVDRSHGQALSPGVSIQAEPSDQSQLAEKLYNHALEQAQQGNLALAIATLQSGLQKQPANAKIRLALDSLLIKEKRSDEAALSLQTGLALDPTHTDMAMLLARLQVAENKNDEAIVTLQRSLPFAADQSDYHALLATLLQQAGKNDEAIEQYVFALRQNPQSGIWWMGLGIAEKAAKHQDAADEAFSKALATQSLSPELQAFVRQQL